MLLELPDGLIAAEEGGDVEAGLVLRVLQQAPGQRVDQAKYLLTVESHSQI